jgi:tryptophan synthase beta subunit
MALLTALGAVVAAGLRIDNLVAANGGGDSFANTGVQRFIIKNADASPKTVTFITQKTVGGGLAVADEAVVVPAGQTYIAGPFPPDLYNDGNGQVQVTYSAVTSVTVGVISETY